MSLSSNNWPHWLPRSARPSIRLTAEQYNYLIGNPALKIKIIAYRNASSEDVYFWLGHESELKQLIKYI